MTDEELKRLDKLEGYPEYYNRFKLPVLLSQEVEEGKVEECFVYMLDRYQDSLLECEMFEEYCLDHAERYALPKDRATCLDREEVIDFTK